MPKSSIEMATPVALSSPMQARIFAGSCISADSVISRVSAAGLYPVVASTRARSVMKSGLSSCLAETSHVEAQVREQVGPPHCELFGAALQHPAPECIDQPQPLGHRDEHQWRNRAAGG